MKNRYVIHQSNKGRSMPLYSTLLIVVALKAFSAPQWLWGAAAMLVLYLWWLFIRDVMAYKETQIDLFQKLKEQQDADRKNRVQDGKISSVSE